MTRHQHPPSEEGREAAFDEMMYRAMQDPNFRDVLHCLYNEQPEGAEFETLKDMLFLHEDFDTVTLRQLVTEHILRVRAGIYRLSDEARAFLAAHPDLLQ